MSSNAAFARAGTQRIRTSMPIITKAYIASAICGAHSINICVTAKIVLFTASMIRGIKLMYPIITICRADTKAVAPATPVTAASAKLADKERKLRDNINIDTERDINAPDTANIDGMNLLKNFTANPNVMNTPAIPANAVIKPCQPIAANVIIVGNNASNAVDKIPKPTAIPIVSRGEGIKRIAIVIAVSAPAKPISPRDNCSHDIPDMIFNVGISINNAVDKIPRPKAMPIVVRDPGIKRIAIVIAAKAPDMEIRPLAISSHERLLNVFIVGTSNNKAKDSSINPKVFRAVVLGSVLTARDTAANNPATETKPFAISSHDISENFLHTPYNILKDRATAIKAIPVPNPNFLF